MEMKEALTAATIFTRLSKGSLQALERAAKVRHYSPGEMLVEEGEEAVAFFVLMSGEAEVVKGVKAGTEVKLEQLKEGNFFGEMALLDGFPRSASVRALTDCEAVVLVRWDFLGTVRANPVVALDILPILSQRLRKCEDMLLP